MQEDLGYKVDHYQGNPRLKRANVNIPFTKEQVKEYVKCSEDPLYFIENYVKIVALDEGLVPFKMYDFQREMIKNFSENRFNISKLPRQSGKCHSINTYITIRNKNTGIIEEITVGEFYERIKKEKTGKTNLQRLWKRIQRWTSSITARAKRTWLQIIR